MNKLNFLPFFEADGGANGGGTGADTGAVTGSDGVNPNGADGTETDKGQDQNEETGKKFTREEMAKKIAAEKAKWQKELDEKEAEAKKLAKMNAEEKAEHERQKLQDKIDELEQKEQLRSMASEASKMLTDANLPHDEDLLNLIVSADAESTKKAVEVVKNYVARIKKESVRQSTPGEGGKFETNQKLKSSLSEMAKGARIIKQS